MNGVDVLAVMGIAATTLHAENYSGTANSMDAARAAVAELIDAVDAERKGEYHDSEVEFRVNYHARRHQEKKRVAAALRRVKGESE